MSQLTDRQKHELVEIETRKAFVSSSGKLSASHDGFHGRHVAAEGGGSILTIVNRA